MFIGPNGWGIGAHLACNLPTDFCQLVQYISADGNYSDVYLTNGKPHKMTFKLHFFDEKLQLLADKMFVRVGKSLIVNRNYIYVINTVSQELLLSGNRLRVDFKLKASKEALKQLKTLMEKEDWQ